MLPARGDRVVPTPPSGPLGPALGGGRWSLPPRGAPGLAHPTGHGGGVGSGAFCAGTGTEGADREFQRSTDTLASSALHAIGSGAWLWDAASHPWGATPPPRSFVGADIVRPPKPPLKREVARRSRDGGFLPPPLSAAPAGDEKPPVTAWRRRQPPFQGGLDDHTRRSRPLCRGGSQTRPLSVPPPQVTAAVRRSSVGRRGE